MNDLSTNKNQTASALTKVAEVTLLFWLLKIIATTLGETAGDALSMTLGLGYVTGLAITAVLLVAVLFAQISARQYRMSLFWLAIVATTTMGTEISDMMDRTLGLGYVWGSVILVSGLLATLAVWYYRKRDLGIGHIVRTDTEIMFWIAVIFSNSLGTAFGDALVDVVGLSYIQGAFVTAGVIGVVLALHYATRVNAIVLFWVAFIFTRPFGATFGDFLTKSVHQGGLELGRLQASAVAVALMGTLMLVASRPWIQRRLA